MAIVYDQLYPPTMTDLAPVVRAIKATDPDIVFAAAYPPDTVALIRAADEVGLSPKMIGGTLVGTLITPLKIQLGPLMNGWLNNAEVYVPSVPAFNFPGVKDVLKKYHERAKGQHIDPFGYNYAPFTYAAGQVLATAVQATNSFGVSNGWWLSLYDRDADDPTKPILTLAYNELPARFRELYALIGATQLTFELKRRMLRRIERVLGADVDLARTDEFVREVQGAAARARPRVLENFRRNAPVQEAAHAAQLKDYLDQSGPYELIDTVLMWPMNMGSMSQVSGILARKVAEHPGSNQYMFFHRLFVVEPRAVTIRYYVNAFHLMGILSRFPALSHVDYPRMDGKRSTPIGDLFVDFARLLLFHFSERPELRVMWTMEALTRRMVKRALLSNTSTRKEIAAGVDLERYLRPEEEMAYLGPSPARTLVQAIESITLAELGAFFNRHYTRLERRDFDVRGAIEEFSERRRKCELLETATDAAYRKLVADLGQDWQELYGNDSINRNWDRLGFAVCEVLSGHVELLRTFPEPLKQRLVYLARLGNTFARQCAENIGISVPAGNFSDIDNRLRLLFDPTATGTTE